MLRLICRTVLDEDVVNLRFELGVESYFFVEVE
jgi:hypothetical protein